MRTESETTASGSRLSDVVRRSVRRDASERVHRAPKLRNTIG